MYRKHADRDERQEHSDCPPPLARVGKRRDDTTAAKRLKAAAGTAIAVALTSLATPAQAATLHMCGHTITTAYFEGWVVIKNITGVNWDSQRPDIVVSGVSLDSSPPRQSIEEMALIAIYLEMRWSYGQSELSIRGYPACRVALV